MTLVGMKHEDPLFKIGQNERGVRWFEEPRANHVYGVALDPSMGTGSDFSAIQVVDLTTMTQVAEWRSNKVSTPDQVDLLRKILLFIHQTLYNDPNQEGEPEIYWTVENNSLGEAALVPLMRLVKNSSQATSYVNHARVVAAAAARASTPTSEPRMRFAQR
jgi:hypothetical protein